MKRIVSAFLLVVVVLGLLPIHAFALIKEDVLSGTVYVADDVVTFPGYGWGDEATNSSSPGKFVAQETADGLAVYALSSTALQNRVLDLSKVKGSDTYLAPWDMELLSNKNNWSAKTLKSMSGDTYAITMGSSLRFLYELYLVNHGDYTKSITADSIKAGSVDFSACKVYLTQAPGMGWTLHEPPYSVVDYARGIAPYSMVYWNGSWVDINSITLDVVRRYNPNSGDEANKNTLALLVWLKQIGAFEKTNIQLFSDVDSAAQEIWKKFDLSSAVVDETLQEAKDQLGDPPPDTASFKEKAIWSARAYVVYKQSGAANPEAGLPVTKDQVLSSNELTDLEKYTIASLFNLLDFAPPSTTHITVEGASAAPPIDATTEAYALNKYNSLAASESLNNDYLRMEALLYKIQATMGLASKLLSSSDGQATAGSVTKQGIEDFRSVAFGDSMADVSKYMFADVTDVKSPHLGNAVNTEWLYYLMVSYNEFAAYGTTLIKNLAPLIVEGQTVFSGYAKDLSAIKALYETASWLDDPVIWEVWNTSNKHTDAGGTNYNSLKAIYDYLLSVNAFDAIDSYDPSSVSSPLKYFFGRTGDATSGGGWQLSSDMRTGIAASTSYLPMKTNLYDPYTFSGIVDTSWLVNFHSKFGYNRKALYIDTNVDSAVNFQRTGTRGSLRVCTLQDLLSADKDIVLYLDDNLYNVNVLADLTDKAFNRLDNVDGASSTREWWQKMGDAIVGIWDVSMENIAKTAESTTYSSTVQNQYSNEAGNKDGKWNTFFLSADEDGATSSSSTALHYLKPDDLWDDQTGAVYSDGKHEASSYTPLTAFAVLSAVYADSELFNSLNSVLNKNTPVFISSPTMPYVEGADKDERQSIYNYLLLKNLDSQMSIDYATNLDMTSPVYMDVYGNILTESGLVVVPAAANATLWNSSYSPYNAAFLSTYGDDFLLEYDEKATEFNKVFDGVLAPVDGYWRLASIKVVGGNIDLARLSTADKDSLSAITEIFKADLYKPQGIYSKSLWEMIITEVLRGAPIEHINKDFEGLNLSHRVTKNGLVIAEKLEFLVNALSAKGTNTTLSIPNPAYMDGIEYVVFFAFKILILAILVIWMVTIYADAVGGGVNFQTGAKCLGVVLLVLSLIVGVPAAFELSYYQSNKLLLQEETEYLMMLNLEKSESGQEIGISSIHEPDTNTTLYLKLADVQIPWWDLLPKIIISSSANNLEALYAEYEGQHPISGAKDVTVLNDAVYISTDKLFGSSSITFSPTLKTMWQQSSGDTPASYYTPYYYFLEQLINKTNTWVKANNYYSYTTKVQRGGKLKTLGYVQPYFTSEQFMQEGMDYFGLYTLYDATPPMVYTDELLLGDSELSAVRASQWCNLNMSEDARIARIEKLNQYAREWVARHKELLGKVTDETFLKCMALSCAMEHNRLFNTMRADNLEIYELSNEDLMRLSIADHDTVMKSSTMSYARFVFTVGGTPAVYAAAFLTLVNFLSSWVKPIATLVVFCITCISIFVFKLILRKNNNSIYGYICTILLMCSVNVLGSVFLKLSMYIPSTGLPPTVCILVQIVVQCAYIYALLWVIKTAVKGWRNVGFERYNSGFNKLTRQHQYSVEVDTPKQKNGWDYYNALVERQRRRRRSL